MLTLMDFQNSQQQTYLKYNTIEQIQCLKNTFSPFFPSIRRIHFWKFLAEVKRVYDHGNVFTFCNKTFSFWKQHIYNNSLNSRIKDIGKLHFKIYFRSRCTEACSRTFKACSCNVRDLFAQSSRHFRGCLKHIREYIRHVLGTSEARSRNVRCKFAEWPKQFLACIVIFWLYRNKRIFLFFPLLHRKCRLIT